MIGENLKLLAALYRRPSRAMSRILDEGSLGFGVVAAVAANFVLALGLLIPLWAWIEASVLESVARSAPSAKASAAVPGSAPASLPAPTVSSTLGPERAGHHPASPDVLGVPASGDEQPVRGLMAQALATMVVSSQIGILVGIALLYVPGCILAATVMGPVGSFGVAFRRDYGALLACVLFSWTAAFLPFGLASLVWTGPPSAGRVLLPLGGGFTVFAVLAVVAVRTVFGLSIVRALGAALLGGFGLLLGPVAPLLASPFMLYLVWQFFRGDLSDLQGIFGRRQAFRRRLEAATTLNPRDAEAHYQLGLLHLQRRENEEARQRFEKAIEIDPREADAHYQLGRMARQDGRFEDAIRHFEEVLRQDEGHAQHEIWREVGATYVAATSWPSARWALERFVAKRSHDPEGLLLLGDTLAALDDAPGARDAWQRCVDAVETMHPFRRSEGAPFRKQAKARLRIPRSGG